MTLPSRLYAIVDPLDTGRDPLVLARAMLAGGARLLQRRLKTAATGELLRASASGAADAPAALGQQVAAALRAQGADALLQAAT